MAGRYPEDIFELDPACDGFELDVGVAKLIADHLFAADSDNQTGNLGKVERILIDPSGQTSTHGLGYKPEDVPEEILYLDDERMSYRISFVASSEELVNADYARELKAAMLDSERNSRSSRAWAATTIGGTLGSAAFPLVLAEAGGYRDTFSLSAAGAFGLAFGGCVLLETGKNIIRERVTNSKSWFYDRAINRAAQSALDLYQPPVIPLGYINEPGIASQDL